MRIVIIWQRFLPYHKARLIQLQKALTAKGHQLTAIEVASQDESYGFPEENAKDSQWVTCFPGMIYHGLSADTIHKNVFSALRQLCPDIVFAPATAFPEGMAALMYRTKSDSRVIIMDDAWEMTDRRGLLTRMAKRVIHSLVDGAFIPAESHMKYYLSLNIPKDRIVYGVDVVDNDYYSSVTDSIRKNESGLREKNELPESYFLFVGRFLKRKGIETLIDAFKIYRDMNSESYYDLVLVGDGPEFEEMKRRANGTTEIHFRGRRVGKELLVYYAFAKALIVPSERDPWALVVNEAMASGLPVLLSRGCGSAKTLLHEVENGWTFGPGDTKELAEMMFRMSSLSEKARERMSKISRAIISEWSLDRFVLGVFSALSIPRRDDDSVISRLAVRLWKGRVKTR